MRGPNVTCHKWSGGIRFHQDCFLLFIVGASLSLSVLPPFSMSIIQIQFPFSNCFILSHLWILLFCWPLFFFCLKDAVRLRGAVARSEITKTTATSPALEDRFFLRSGAPWRLKQQSGADAPSASKPKPQIMSGTWKRSCGPAAE